MKNGIICATVVVFFSVSMYAQLPPAPRPVADSDIRDPNSMRMRELQLERIKRESSKIKWTRTDEELSSKFNEIKDDFEKIQKLQASIIKAYTTGKTINYTKINQDSTEMSKKARNLNANLFILNPQPTAGPENKGDEKPKTVRDLIIELDRNIGSFVSNPIFSDRKLLDSKNSEKAGTDLDNIIKLSERLAQEAKKFI
jgi:hypothetical protein